MARGLLVAVMLGLPGASSAQWPGEWVTSTTALDGDEQFASMAQGLLLRSAPVVRWKASQPEQAEVLYEHPASVWAVIASPTVVCSADYRGNLAVMQRPGGEMKMHEGVFQRWTRAMVLSPDGTLLVAGNEAGNLFVWSLQGDAIQSTKQLESQQIYDLAFAPAGDVIAVASGGGQVQIVTWPALEVRQTIKLGEQPVWSVAFADDGATLIAGGSDRTLWRVPLSGEPQGVEIGKTSDWVTSITKIPAGGGYAVGTLSGVLYTIPPAADQVRELGKFSSGIWDLGAASANSLLVATRKQRIGLVGRSWSILYQQPETASTAAAEKP